MSFQVNPAIARALLIVTNELYSMTKSRKKLFDSKVFFFELKTLDFI
jgi:hypothetical protein